jgi:hypothetical protein
MSYITYQKLLIKSLKPEQHTVRAKEFEYSNNQLIPINDNGDPVEGWAGMHEGCEIQLTFTVNALPSNLTLFRLRLYSNQEKSYVTAKKLLSLTTEDMGQKTTTLEVPPYAFAEPSDWGIDASLIEGGETTSPQEQTRCLIERQELFQAYGESSFSLLPLRADLNLEGLWEFRLLIDPEEAEKFSAYEGYEVLVNPNKPGATELLESPFQSKKWLTLPLEVYSHALTELLMRIPAQPSELDTLDKSEDSGSLKHFVASLKQSLGIQDNTELKQHELFLKVRSYLEKR